MVVEPDIFDRVNAAKQFNQRTRNEDGSHQALVCVVCDELIIGVGPFRWIYEKVLRGDNIKDRLGVERYEDHYRVELKDELVRQYTLPDLEGMLLLPQSKHSSDEKRTCCEECFKYLNKSRGSNDDECRPPKKAIANGFACGHIPNKFELKMQTGQQQWSP